MPEPTLPLITLPNHHATLPPAIAAEATYRGYFENAYGEQWLLWREAVTGRVCLAGGDNDWVVHEITPTWFTAKFGEPGSCPLVLELDEQLWINACWRVLHGPATEPPA